MELRHHPKGNYHFLTGIAPYSSAVSAATGFTLVRVQFAAPLPYRNGFKRIAVLLEQFNRPKQALCAVELRIPAPLPFQEFIDFNQEYCAILQNWEIYVGDINPVARTNVAPGAAAPTEPSLYAFTFTMPQEIFSAYSLSQPPTFVVAGAGDLRDQADLRAEAIVHPGDTSPPAMHEKAKTVVQVMTDRLHGIGYAWHDVATTNVYTVHPIDTIQESFLLPRLGAAAIHGVNWYYSRPPIAGLEFEMDLRTIGLNIKIP